MPAKKARPKSERTATRPRRTTKSKSTTTTETTKLHLTKVPTLEVDPLEIHADPDKNVRVDKYDEESLADLVADFRSSTGQAQPIVITPLDPPIGRKAYEVVLGFRRHAAMILANNSLKTPRLLRCEVRSFESLEDRLVLNLSEQQKRRDLSPIEALAAIERLDKIGKTRAAIAKIFGRSPAWVTQTRKLANLDPSVADRVHSGEVSWRAAVELSAAPTTAQVALVDRYLPELIGKSTRIDQKADSGSQDAPQRTRRSAGTDLQSEARQAAQKPPTQAQRERSERPDKSSGPSLTSIRDWFEECITVGGITTLSGMFGILGREWLVSNEKPDRYLWELLTAIDSTIRDDANVKKRFNRVLEKDHRELYKHLKEQIELTRKRLEVKS